MTSAVEGPLPDDISTDQPESAKLWLSISTGAASGRRIAVVGPQFVIGRDQSCNLRLGSPLVSKLHAALLRRDGKVFVRDLGSTNGTILNGRPIRNGEAEVQPGDRVQIGPLVATLSTGTEQREVEPVEDQVITWLRPEGDGNGAEQIGWDDTLTIPTRDADEPSSEAEFEIKCEIIQNVLVVTPQCSALDDHEIVENLRVQLRALYDAPAARGRRQFAIRGPLDSPGDRRALGPPSPARSRRRGLANLPGACPRHGCASSSAPHHARRMLPNPRRGRLGRVAWPVKKAISND